MFWAASGDVSQDTTVVSVPAPIGGLNARDSLAAMPVTDASVMQNWWPQPYGVSVRKGYKEWATGFPDSVRTLAAWSSVTGTGQLFAWSLYGMYNISAVGPIGAAVVSGLATADWDTVNCTNSAGSFLIALTGNAIDNGIIYNGSTYNRLIAGDGIVANTWAGIDPRNAFCPTLHQHRLWVLKRDSTVGYYLPPDAIQGTFVAYDFGPLFSKGGYAQFMCTWTLDDGSGATDHLIVVSSRGEAAVFRGTNPSSDATWGLSGVYFIGEPVKGTRAFTKAGGDVLIVTTQGVVSMSNMLTSTRVSEAANRVTSDKIQFRISELTTLYSSLFGWDLEYFPLYNMVLVNVPTSFGALQLAANQLTNAWTEFDGMNASCFATRGTVPYFGSPDGRVFSFWDGNLDEVLLDGTNGKSIITSVMQAYSYFGEMATQKQVGMYRPAFLVNAPVTLNSVIAYDFVTPPLTTPAAVISTLASAWGSALWDVAVWGGSVYSERSWYQADGVGVAAALRMVVASVGEVLWISTDYSVVKGKGLF